MFESSDKKKNTYELFFNDYVEIKNLRQKLYEKVGVLSLSDAIPPWIYERTMKKLQTLKEVYGEERDSYASAHVLLHSTLPQPDNFIDEDDKEHWEGSITHSDFEEEDSVRKFYTDLLTEVDGM